MTDFMHTISWLIDLLDIFLVAFIIYRVLLLFKETLSHRFVIALAALLLLSLVSRAAGFRALNWIFDNLFGSIILILVVIFQHDIRRALVTMRRNRLGDLPSRDEAYEVIDELASAAEALAQKNIGALVVIEREMLLTNFIAVGTEIDAKVTSELITSIFLPYSPIHDGAVIIQKGKLTKAGCFLPLTQNPSISKSLGTRHRAAIGLTEVVDAVVLVVSEETGRISVVVDGRITRDLEPAVLRKVMKRLIEPRWLK
jgi:diadenylate cyclase